MVTEVFNDNQESDSSLSNIGESVRIGLIYKHVYR